MKGQELIYTLQICVVQFPWIASIQEYVSQIELCKSVQTTLRINFKTSPKYVQGNARLLLFLYVCVRFVLLVHSFFF